MLKAFLGLWMVMMTSYSAAGQTDDSLEYVKQVRDFIIHAPIETLRDSMNILVDLPSGLFSPIADCLDVIKNDSTHISKAYLEYIFKESQTRRIKRWPPDISPRIKVISSDTVNLIFDDHLSGWDHFHKNFGRSINRFSLPVFFGDKYCLFYSDTTCGSLCGEGSWKLYSKEEGTWVIIREYCNWIS
ncbi:MAG TPA: hypothetical protein VFE04_10850 [Puia sp.]|nr:hypothetical protein [Puia sp.]